MKNALSKVVCANCGLKIENEQLTHCPRCGKSLLALGACSGSCFTCKKDCLLPKQ